MHGQQNIKFRLFWQIFMQDFITKFQGNPSEVKRADTCAETEEPNEDTTSYARLCECA